MPIKLNRHQILPASLILLTALALVSGRTQQTDEPVDAGKTVTFEYTISEQGGAIVDTNVGRDPVEYVHGQDQILPGLEEALTGMNAGEEKSVTLEPEDAYGPTDPEAFQEVPAEQVPAEARSAGARLAAPGIAWPVLVNEIRPDTVVLDLNHPLAGKTLTFVVRILSVR